MSSTSRVSVTEPAPIALAAVRRRARGPALGKVVQEGCGDVWRALRAQGLKGGRNVALYWDGEINVDVGVEMPDAFEPTADVRAVSTPAGLVATITHVGPYPTLGAAHDAIQAWAKQSGRTLAGPRWEIYGHWQPEWNDDPSRIQTDVSYLIAPS